MIKSYYLALLALLGGFTHAGPLLTDGEATRLLDRVARAAREMPYQGVYVQQRGGVIETYRLYHGQLSGQEAERRQSLDGSARELLRHGEIVSLFVPENARVALNRSMAELAFPQLPHGAVESIVPNYQILPAGQARVAGLDAEVYALQPRDKLRYPKKLWVHRQSGLLLKVALQSGKREFDEIFAFSQLELVGKLPSSSLQVASQAPAATVQLRRSFPVVQAEHGWEVGDLPAGYRLIRRSHRTMNDASQPVIHHVYSDGLCSISIFLEVLRDGLPQGLLHQGLTHILGRDVDGFHVTVVGDAPLLTIEKFSKAYRPDGKGAKK